MRKVLLLLFVALLISPALAATTVTWSGEKIITGFEEYSSTEISSSANITIRNGGQLILNNSQLLVSSESDGQYSISIEAGGEMNVVGSRISSTDPAKHYALVFQTGSQGSLESSTITDTLRGVEIYTPDLVISNSTIQNSANACIWAGEGSDGFVISNSTIEGNAVGIEVTGTTSGEIINNTIASNETSGILVSDEATVDISGNTIVGGDNAVRIIGSAEADLSGGENTFVGQTGDIIINETGNTIPVGGNDWGTTDPEEIADLISGPTDIFQTIDQTLSPQTGITITIPAGATTQLVTLTVEAVAANPGTTPTGKVLASTIYDLQGDATTFTTPISITLPTERGHYGMAPYYWTGTEWSNTGLIITSTDTSSITFTTTHFSYYAVFASQITGRTPICVPSPFNPPSQPTTIIYWLDTAANTTIYIFDPLGNLIYNHTYLTTDPEGGHTDYNRVTWDGSSPVTNSTVNNGPYIIKVVSGGRMIGKTKVVVLR